MISTWELLDRVGSCTPDFLILLVASCLRCMVRVTMQLRVVKMLIRLGLKCSSGLLLLLLLLLRPHVHLCLHMVIHQDHPKLVSRALLRISMLILVYVTLVHLFQFQQVVAILVNFINCPLLLLLLHLHKFMEAPQFCNLTKSLCSICSGIPLCIMFHLQYLRVLLEFFHHLHH